MADYYSQCVVSPTLPLGEITAAEQLILRTIFDSEIDNGELYLFAEVGHHDTIDLDLPDMQAALAETTIPSAATRLLIKAVADLACGEETATLDLQDEWIEIFQDIIGRSAQITFITIETSFTCSKMRPDGFGGSAQVITQANVDTMSTSQFIDETLATRFPPLTKPALTEVLEANT